MKDDRTLLPPDGRHDGTFPMAPAPWLAALHEQKGLGKEVWEGIDPHSYVRRLRED